MLRNVKKSWAVATKFDRDPLVSGEDEEKRLANAEKEVTKELAAKKEAAPKGQPTKWTRKTSKSGKRPLWCDYCQVPGHTIHKCWYYRPQFNAQQAVAAANYNAYPAAPAGQPPAAGGVRR